MSRWIDIAKKKPLEVLDEKSGINKVELDKKTIDLNEVIDYGKLDIQEELESKILDTYGQLVDEVNEGLYGFIFCEDRWERMSSFVKLVHRHLDYDYYLKTDSRENQDPESDISEDIPWENKRNRFAYT